MAKFNQNVTAESREEKAVQAILNHPNATVNHEGGLHFNVSPALDLYLSSVTNLLEGKFYESNTDAMQRISGLCKQCGRKYVLQLAAYCRTKMNLRSISVALLVEACTLYDESPNEPKPEFAIYIPQILLRADEPAEFLAAYTSKHGTKARMPNAVRRAVAKVLAGFNEYQFAKYKGSGKEVALYDVFNVFHPKPQNDEQAELFKRVIEGNLATPSTWETYISENGASAETWNHIAKDMGIMALIRNVRNFEQHDATEAISILLDRLRNAETVLNSKQIPFRWLSARDHVTSSTIKDALEEAAELSLKNLPVLNGSSHVFVDGSGSMGATISRKSKVSRHNTASLLGAIILNKTIGEYGVSTFSSEVMDVDISRRNGLLSNAGIIRAHCDGGVTYAYKCIQSLIDSARKVDHVFIISDMQCYNERAHDYWYFTDNEDSNETLATIWNRYLRAVNPNAMLYSIDVCGHGGSQFPEDSENTVLVGGWSEKILDMIEAIRNGSSAVQEIKNM
jgi:60 kDa SS-A/Ro ribonucleoprotein